MLAAVADELRLPAGQLDAAVPSWELGLAPQSRARLVERVNAELDTELPAGSFPAGISLDELANVAAAAQPSPVPAPAAPDDVAERAEEYLKSLLAAEARLPADRIRTRAPLQDYGINSVLIARLNQRLERELGEPSATLFFEYQTIHDLARYLARAHRETVLRLAAPARDHQSPAQQPSAPEPPSAGQAEPSAGQARLDAVPRPDAVPEPRPQPSGDIAVIGMAGRYPRSGDNAEFWRNLLAGVDCITEVPADRWDHSRYLSEDPDLPGTTYARWGGFVPDVDRFDARFFNVAPKDAETLDPQQRLFLETSWAAVEDAGYTPGRIKESARRRGKADAGVFVGVTYGEYQLYVGVPIAPYWAVANRVSYHLNLSGPSLAVDTACSASLTAIHLACQSLRTGECGYAIAGGVNLSLHPGKYLLLAGGRWASTDGRCRAFGAGGDGYVPGEGVVSLLLKPLAEAEADGDRIYGVIKATATNSDGRTNGLTVPNPVAQTELVHRTLTQAGVDARSISYVEAHGTGTALGDPIEINALTTAFRRFTSDCGYCAIGSAKSAIGHLEAAAGAAGLAKTLLQLQHETIAPSLHADPPNPNIDFADTPFRVAHTAQAWRRMPGGPARLAAVSSFGAGGSNAHVIVQEAPAPAAVPPDPGYSWPVLLSARRPDRLEVQARNLLSFLRSAPGATTPLRDIAWTLMVGREAFEHRLAVVAGSAAELADRLEDFLRGGAGARVFTGQVPAHQDWVPGESQADRDLLAEYSAQGRMDRLAEFWAQGWAIDWELLLASRRGHIVSLPGYPFARDRYWVAPEDYGLAPASASSAVPTGSASSTGSVPNAVPTGSVPARAVPVPLQDPPPAPPQSRELGPRQQPYETLRADLETTIKVIFAEFTKHPVDELDVDADFLDFGFDSVVTVRMLNRLMKTYGVQIPGASVEEHPSIRSLASYLLDSGIITTGGNAPAAPAASSADAVLDAPAREVEPVTLDAPLSAETIFITGVTGVLGGRLLYDLLASTSTRVYCLARAKTLAAARERIRYFLEVYDVEGRLASEFERRVIPVLGDVSRDLMGLDQGTWDRLAAEVDLTIHAAARTTLVAFYDTLAPVNVIGTRRAVDFALRTKYKRLAYVSSFSSLGDWLIHNNPPFGERDIELGQGYENLPYQQTKYHAEKMIRAASDQGLLWNIFRPGNIMGDSRTGRYPLAEVTVKGVFYDIFKTTVETGISMLTPNYWDITPVDYVSAGLLHLALRRPVYREVYHLTNPDIRTLHDVFSSIRDYGYDVRPVSIAEYHRMATEGAFRAAGSGQPYQSQMIEMVKYGIEVWGREHYEQSAYPDCTFTAGILGAAGITCPAIADLIPIYLDYCVDEGFLTPPRHLAVPAALATPGGH